MHEQIETAQAFNVARLLLNRASFLENDRDERGKAEYSTHWLNTNGRGGSICLPPVPTSDFVVNVALALANSRASGAICVLCQLLHVGEKAR